MKKFALLLITLCFTSTLLGCNTIKGVGEDLSSLGKGISGGSEKVQSK